MGNDHWCLYLKCILIVTDVDNDDDGDDDDGDDVSKWLSNERFFCPSFYTLIFFNFVFVELLNLSYNYTTVPQFFIDVAIVCSHTTAIIAAF